MTSCASMLRGTFVILFSLILCACMQSRTRPRGGLGPDARSTPDLGVDPDARTMFEDAMSPMPDTGQIADSGIEDAMPFEDAAMSIDVGPIADAGTSPCGCAGNEYCEFSTRFSCSAPGTCITRPEACPEIVAPVCGCNKIDYTNECEAHSAGVDISHEDECDCRDLGCASTQWCQPCRTTTGLAYVCLPRGAVC